MRNKNKLLIEQLDQKLVGFKSAASISVPDRGWIHTVRKVLGMTMKQLGAKLDLSAGAVQKIEERESMGQISVNKLKEVGNALGLKFVYGFVPIDGSIDNMVTKRAEELAERIVLRTNQNMQLEDQGIPDEKIKESIKDLAIEIKREMRRSLWD